MGRGVFFFVLSTAVFCAVLLFFGVESLRVEGDFDVPGLVMTLDELLCRLCVLYFLLFLALCEM